MPLAKNKIAIKLITEEWLSVCGSQSSVKSVSWQES